MKKLPWIDAPVGVGCNQYQSGSAKDKAGMRMKESIINDDVDSLYLIANPTFPFSIICFWILEDNGLWISGVSSLSGGL